MGSETINKGGQAMRLIVVRGCVIAATLVSAATALHAQSKEEYFKGKQISVIIGYPPGGSFGVYGRTLARHMGKHIPGNPTFVPRNMPGGGSLVAANYIFNAAPKDGLTLGLIVPTAALEERLGASNVRFKAEQFNYIGRFASAPSVTFMNASSSVKTIQDAIDMESTLGATGRSSTVALFPMLLNQTVGTKFKLVMGYPGSSDAMLAMDRGEIEGFTNTWDGVKARGIQYIQEKSINVIVQYGLQRHPDLPNVPTSVELAKTPEQLEDLSAFAASADVGRYLLTTPNTPKDRVELLRRAFDATMLDPEFIDEIKSQNVELLPLRGEDVQKLVGQMASISPGSVERLKRIYVSE